MSPELQSELTVAMIGAILNAAVTWGVVSTKLAWMRRDIDTLMKWRERFMEREAA
jgi:hypothetical protein